MYFNLGAFRVRRISASVKPGQVFRMAIKEEERQETAGTTVENGPASTDVNTRTGMTNTDFELFQKRDVSAEQEFRDDL